MFKKIKLLTVLLLLLLVGCGAKPKRYENVYWSVDSEYGYVDVISQDKKEWHIKENRLDMVIAESNGSGLKNYFYVYNANYYRLVVYMRW